MPIDLQVASYTGIWRGLMIRRRGVDHPELYATDALNVEMQGNVLAKRKGVQRLNALGSPYGSSTNHRIYALYYAHWRYGSGGQNELLIAAGNMIQRQADPPGPSIVTPATLPPGTPVRGDPQFPVQFTQFNNQIFIVDGTNPNLKLYLRGSAETIAAVGINPPTVPAGVSLVAATPGFDTTVATGYRYRYTYVNSFTRAESDATDVEGSPPADTGAPDYKPLDPIKPGAGQGVQVTWTPSTDPQVDLVRIYRTLDGGETYLFLDEVPQTPATYLDQASDLKIEASSLYEEFTNTVPPERLRLVVPWVQANRLLGVSTDQPSIVYYSDLILGQLKPEAWPAENMIFVARDAGDEIVGLFPFTDSVLIFGRRSTFRLRGIPPDDLVLDAVQYEDDMRTAVGSLAQKSLIQVDDALINPAMDGAYAINRFIDTQGGFTNDRISRPIDDLWEHLTPNETDWSHGLFIRSKKQIRLWLPRDGRTLPDRALIYQLDVSATANEPAGWTIWETKGELASDDLATVTASVVVETTHGDVAYIGTEDGYLGQMDTGLNDWWYDPPGIGAIEQGRTYPFLWQGVPVYLSAQEQPTRLRFVDVVWAADSKVTVSCTPVTDFDVDWPAIYFTLEPTDGFILDISQLDIGRLAPDMLRHEARGSALTRGALHTVRWRCDQDASFQLEKWRLLWQPLAQKSRMVDAVQQLPDVDNSIGFGGEHIYGFGEKTFGGRRP